MCIPELIQRQYVISPGPMEGKIGLPFVLERLGVKDTNNKVNIFDFFPVALIGLLNRTVAPFGPSFILGKPMQERIKSATDLVTKKMNENPNCGLIALEPFHLNWNLDISLRKRMFPLQLNRLWNEQGDKLGIGPRPDQSTPNGFIPLEEQINIIRQKLDKLNIKRVFIFEDIVDSGGTLDRLIGLFSKQQLIVEGLILSGIIYPENKQKLLATTLQEKTIDSVGIPNGDRSNVTRGGFNAADCLIGGLGNTVGTEDLRPKFVAERSDGSPLPAGIFYSSRQSWQSFAKDTPIDNQPTSLNFLLDLNVQFWKSFEEVTGKKVTFADLSRFPYGIGLDPDSVTLRSNVPSTIRDLSNNNNSAFDFKPNDGQFKEEKVSQIKTLIFDIDGVIRDKKGNIPPEIIEGLKQLKQLGLSIWFNTMRTQNTFMMIDGEVQNALSDIADGVFFERGAVRKLKGKEPEILVRNREIIQEYANQFSCFTNTGKFKRITTTQGCEYFIFDRDTIDPQEIQKLIDEFKNKFAPPSNITVENTGEGSIIITNQNCTKGSALLSSNIDLSNALVVGNGLSDISMFIEVFKKGGISVCVDKSTPAPNFYSSLSGLEGTMDVLTLLINSTTK